MNAKLRAHLCLLGEAAQTTAYVVKAHNPEKNKQHKVRCALIQTCAHLNRVFERCLKGKCLPAGATWMLKWVLKGQNTVTSISQHAAVMPQYRPINLWQFIINI